MVTVDTEKTRLVDNSKEDKGLLQKNWIEIRTALVFGLAQFLLILTKNMSAFCLCP